MDIKNYLTEEKIAKLSERGVDDKDIISKIELFTEQYSHMDYSEEVLLKAVKNRVGSYFGKFLGGETVQYTGIVLNKKPVDDQNKKYKEYATKNAGKDYKDSGYIVKEGYITWTFGNYKQGEPIPEGNYWKQELMVGVDNNGTLDVKTVTLEGDWVINKELNDVVVGDIIKFQAKNTFFEYKGTTIYKYSKGESLNESTWANLLTTSLKPYVKTLQEVSEIQDKSNTFVIVTADIGDLERSGSGYRFMLIDDTINNGGEIDISKTISGSMSEPNFVEGAIGVILFGDIYVSNEVTNMNIGKAIVPKGFEKVELTKATFQVIETSIDDDIDGAPIVSNEAAEELL